MKHPAISNLDPPTALEEGITIQPFTNGSKNTNSVIATVLRSPTQEWLEILEKFYKHF